MSTAHAVREDHDHQHGPDCGHVSVVHDDHWDEHRRPVTTAFDVPASTLFGHAGVDVHRPTWVGGDAEILTSATGPAARQSVRPTSTPTSRSNWRFNGSRSNSLISWRRNHRSSATSSSPASSPDTTSASKTIDTYEHRSPLG